MRALSFAILALCLLTQSACTAMMVGGGTTYEAPAEDCEKGGSSSASCER